jgi:adenine-specific DNA glycosylase
VDDASTLRDLWFLARSLVHAAEEGAAGQVNEGLMELGATGGREQQRRGLGGL